MANEISKVLIGSTTYEIKDKTARDLIAGMTSIKFEPVDVLPTTGVLGTIYLVPHSHAEKDKYDEWVWIVDTTKPEGGYYEKLGSTDIDLSSYPNTAITNSEIDTVVAS